MGYSNSMIFRQLIDFTSNTFTYIVGCEATREAIIIDPVQEHLALYLELLAQLELNLKIAHDTHTHADHITATGALANHTGCKIALAEQSKAQCHDIALASGDVLHIGDLRFKTLYTPGHTDDCSCLVMNDRVFTGDTLMIRATGRTDFQSGSASDEYHSIKDQLFALPDDTLVYPSHDYRGMTVSTIGEEKRFNPRASLDSEAEFVDVMNNLNLPKPKLIDIAVPANLQCGQKEEKNE